MVRSNKKLRQQRHRRFLIVFGVIVVGLVIGAIIKLSRSNMAVLTPAGPIAAGEKRLLVTAFLLMLLVVVPVFVLLATIAWHYRETNTKAKYQPNFDHSRLFEAIWWLIPSALIAVLAVMTWHGTYKYDPYKPVASKTPALRIQAVAESGWWLFIYPQQGIASVNRIMVPVNTPVSFEITADAPMNSLWIPQLTGQMYAMPGMTTQLNMLATKMGNYRGVSANISGPKFADMHFETVVTTPGQYQNWVTVSREAPSLSTSMYNQIVKYGYEDGVNVYGQYYDPSLMTVSQRSNSNIFDYILNKYMTAGQASMSSSMHMEGM